MATPRNLASRRARRPPRPLARRPRAEPRRRRDHVARDRRRLSRAHRSSRRVAACVRRRLARRGARARRRGGPRASRGPRARPARRSAGRAQGPPARRRTPDDGGLEELARAHLRSHRDGRRAPRRCRDDPARQDAHGRVRVRRVGAQRPDGRAVESMGPPHPSRRRRLVERFGGRGGRGARARRTRLRHWRLHPDSRLALRHHRVQADVRTRELARCRAAVDDARLGRSARAHGGGRGARPRRDGRRGSGRRGDPRRAARRLRGRARARP